MLFKVANVISDIGHGAQMVTRNAAKGADAILILTEWEQFKHLNWEDISSIMRQPAWIFDSRGIVDPISVRSAGLKLWRVGDGGE